MKLAKKELADIHNDWVKEIDALRKKEFLPKVKEEIIKYIKIARTNTGDGIVSYSDISDLIKKTFDKFVCPTTVSRWHKRY